MIKTTEYGVIFTIIRTTNKTTYVYNAYIKALYCNTQAPLRNGVLLKYLGTK